MCLLLFSFVSLSLSVTLSSSACSCRREIFIFSPAREKLILSLNTDPYQQQQMTHYQRHLSNQEPLTAVNLGTVWLCFCLPSPEVAQSLKGQSWASALSGRKMLIPNDKLQIFSHLQSHKYPKILMKAARAGLEGTNKMHYEFTNARTFISTNNSRGRNVTKGRQIPQ